ncbi:hypothetical protein RCG24_16785 [Neobacillus sp. OS1-32]|uniref:hypothetical protein n=1 Tax=Neobacillus TaxID=2675232 RepID=UPI001F1D0A29|nr:MULTISPECIES: hypothetical protein [Neobacillus]WML29560.1 hypothetical protein RCG24_16785 [Neobacillus sp. OS1-32]
MKGILQNRSLAFLIIILLAILPVLSGFTKDSPKSTKTSGEKASLVLKNGIVYTMEKSQPTAQAIAAKNGKIIYVGSTKVSKNMWIKTPRLLI